MSSVCPTRLLILLEKQFSYLNSTFSGSYFLDLFLRQCPFVFISLKIHRNFDATLKHYFVILITPFCANDSPFNTHGILTPLLVRQSNSAYINFRVHEAS